VSGLVGLTRGAQSRLANPLANSARPDWLLCRVSGAGRRRVKRNEGRSALAFKNPAAPAVKHEAEEDWAR
jgi:hypothetical protein